MPNKKIIAPSAYSKYDFSINDQDEKENHSMSNSLSLDVIHPLIRFDLTLLSLPEVNQEQLSFQLILENVGEFPFTNLTISIPSSEHFDFVENSLMIDKKKNNGNLILGVSLPSLEVKEKVVFTYMVRFHENITTYKVPVSASLYYETCVDDVVSSDTLESNIIQIDVLKEKLMIYKIVNKTIASLNDTVHVTTLLQNLGNIPLHNLVLNENISIKNGIIDTTIYINAEKVVMDDPYKIIIPLLKENSQVVVSYDLKIGKIPLKKENIELETNVSYFSQNVLKSAKSNKVCVDIQYALLQIKKEVSKTKVKVGEHLTYKIIIENTGNIAAKNVVFQDTIAEGMKLVEESLIVNDVARTDANPNIGFTLSDIPAKEIVTITYQTIVL